MRDLRRRVSRLEDVLGLPPMCTLVRIRGGVAGEGLAHASVGALRFQRLPDEPQDLSEARAIAAAEAAGEPFAFISGMPDQADANLQ